MSHQWQFHCVILVGKLWDRGSKFWGTPSRSSAHWSVWEFNQFPHFEGWIQRKKYIPMLGIDWNYPPIISGDPAVKLHRLCSTLTATNAAMGGSVVGIFALIFFFSPTKTGKVQMDFAIFWVDESYKPGDRRCWGSYERRYSEITVLWSEIKISPFWRREAVKKPAQLFLWSFQSFRFHSWNLGTILLECEMCHICDAFGFPRLSSAAPRFFQWRFQFSKAFSADFSAGDDYRFLTRRSVFSPEVCS